MKIAVLAVQGAFIEHEKALQRLGAETVELRKAEDLEQDFDGLVLPGGESTVQSRLLKELSMFEPCDLTCYCKEKCLRKTAWKLLLRRRD